MPISDLPIPEQGAVPSLQIPEQTTVTPEAADVSSYALTAGPARRGLRAGFNQLGSMANAFVSSVADATGLEEFAQERMKDAEQQARFADAVSPEIRDYRQVKDFTSLTNFVSGLIGQSAATMAPAVAGAAIGRGVGGLRGAFAGAFGGSFIPNAGEQALRIKDVKRPAGDKLRNVMGAGGAEAALDMLVPGSVVGRAGKKAAAESIGKAVGKNAGTEAITEAAQEGIGQAMHTALDSKRDKSSDTSDIINSAIAGGIGGGALGGGGAVISKIANSAPAMLDKLTPPEAKDIAGKTQTEADIEKHLGVENAPVDENDIHDILSNDKLTSEQDIVGALEKKGSDAVESLSKVWDKVKDEPAYKKFENFRDDPEVRAEFTDKVKQRFNDLEIAPKIKKAFDGIQAFAKGASDKLREKVGTKESKQRTAMDFAIYDNMLAHLDEGVAKNLTPQQKLELADYVKHIAMYEHAKRDEIAGPGKPAFSNEEKGLHREQDRGTTPRRLPVEMLHMFGDKSVEVLNSTNKLLAQGGLAKENDFGGQIKDTQRYDKARTTAFEDLVRSNLRAEIASDPKARETAAKVLAPRLLDAVMRGHEQLTVKKGGFVDRPAAEMMNRGRFEEELKYAFGDNKEVVMEELDKMRQRMTVTPDTFFEQGIADESGATDVQAEGSIPQEETQADQKPGAQDQGPFGDKRLGVPIRGLDAAKSTLDALESEYDPRRVAFTIQQTEDGRYTVEAKDRIGEDSFSDKEWQDIREPEEHGKSGLSNGIMTVQLKDGRQNKINLIRLTSQTIRQTPRQDVGNVNYVYDVVSRGLSRLLADPQVKGLNKNTEAQTIKGPEAWDLPDSTPVAVINKRTYTWGEVKARVNISSDELRIRRITANAVEQAQEAQDLTEIQQRILPFLDARISDIERMYTEAKLQAAKSKKAKDRSEQTKLFNWLERVRGAKERVMTEVDRREQEGDAPRSDVRGLVEDTRQRGTTAAETPVGQRVVESDTGRPIGEGGKKATPSQVQEKKSTMNVDQNGEITKEQAEEVRAYINKVLGPDAKVFFKRMEAAGTFAKIEGAEVIRIAVNAINPLGVARHEAAHALVARLMATDKRTAQTLMAAAGSPTVVARLRQLLKDHPKAVNQLTDPEERLAYMYQFWAAGSLKVGPNTKTVFDKIKGFFRKIAGIWSETYDNVRNADKAQEVFSLFEEGKLSEPNTVAEVLRDEFPKTPFEKASELMGPISKFINKAFFTADGVVRDMNVPAFTSTMDKFFTSVGQQDKGPGFLQTRYMELNKRHNVLHKALDGTTEAQQRAALEALHSRSSPTDPAVRKAVEGVRSLLRETFDYMNKAGVKAVVWSDEAKGYEEHDIGFVENYFPRYYDRQKIFEERPQFEAALRDGGLTAEQAKSVTDNILRSSKVAPDENDYLAGLTYYAPNSQARKLNVEDKVIAPWLQKNLADSVYSYLNYATRRAEYAKRFGNQGQEIEAAVKQAESEGATTEQVKTFNQAVMAMEGSLGHDIKPELKQLFGGIVTYQNFRLLPLALFTSLVDPIGIAVRGGGMKEAYNAFIRGIRGIVKENKDHAYDLAALVGTIGVSHDAHMLADAYGTQYLTDWQRKLNAAFFKYNGMESWNRQMRVAATGAAEKFIIKHAGDFNEHSERFLLELGLTKEDVRVNNGELVLNDKIANALSQWVDGAVLRPNAAVRPIWMSDPHYMLIAHLKQFTYTFQKTIVARVVHEMENGNFTSAYALLSYVPLLIASDLLRATLTPGGGDDDVLERLGLGGLIWRGVQRAGLFGPGQYAIDAWGDLGHGKIPIVSILGPTAQQLYDFGTAAAGHGDLGRELKHAIPGYVFVR